MSLPPFEPLHTDRLTVRPVEEGDLSDLLLVNGDDAVTRFLPYPTWQGLHDGHAWLQRMQGLQAEGATHQLVMARREDGRVIGTVLLFRHDEGSARMEVGYVLGRPYWRQGFAREALQAACQQAFDAFGLRRIEAEVDPDNLASNALLRGLGFTFEGRLRQRWAAKGRTYDTNLYGCLAGELSTGSPRSA